MARTKHPSFYRKQAARIRKAAESAHSGVTQSEFLILARLYDRLASSVQAKLEKQRSQKQG